LLCDKKETRKKLGVIVFTQEEKGVAQSECGAMPSKSIERARECVFQSEIPNFSVFANMRK